MKNLKLLSCWLIVCALQLCALAEDDPRYAGNHFEGDMVIKWNGKKIITGALWPNDTVHYKFEDSKLNDGKF